MSTLYFAYGSNMDNLQMANRCPGAESAGTASLPGYRFIINDRGYATLLKETGLETPGVLWRLHPSDEAALDRYEGYRRGLYDKGFRAVRDGAGNEPQALVYIDHQNCSPGAPLDGYLERISAAATAHELPPKHLDLLRAWPRQEAFRSFNRLVTRVKSGHGMSRSIIKHKEALSDWVKQRRDDLMLKALDSTTHPEAKNAFMESLEEIVLREVEEAAERLELARTGDLALEYMALGAFVRHIESLHRETELHSVLSESNQQGELAGQGIIITSDPKRPHDPGDRVIVTRNAPFISALWDRVFSGSHGLHARACPFLDAFADVAEKTGENALQQVVNDTLERVKKLALERHDRIRLEIEESRVQPV